MRATRAAILPLTCCVLPPAEAQLLPQGPQFQVNTHSTNEQYGPAVAALTDGGFVVVWVSEGSDGGDSSEWSLQAQRDRRAIFADGFEDGTTDAWGVPVP